MSPMKWLNSLLFIENILGIYRNYCIQTKIKKFFIIFQTFTQIILHSIVIIGVIKLVLEGDKYDQKSLIYGSFLTLASVNTILSVVIGICYSHVFMSYYRSINRIFGWFAYDQQLTKSLKKMYWFSFTFVLFSIIFVAYRTLDILIRFSLADPMFLAIVMASQTITRLNLLLQHLVLFDIIILVLNSFKSLTALVALVQDRVDRGFGWDEQCGITRQQIQGWVVLYRDLANCCDKVTLCFGRQFFFTLTITITSYILLTYQMCYNIFLKNGNIDEFKKSIFVICVYILIMMMPIVAGQMACNQGINFHRVVARLYNTIIIIDSSEAEAQLIKDFIRMIKTNPIKIHLMSKVPAGMYMLPVIFTLAINYVIVMLQFNHVI